MSLSAFPLVDFCVGYRGVPITAGATPQLVTGANATSGIEAGTTAIGAGVECFDTERSEFTVPKTGPYNIVSSWILTSAAASDITMYVVVNGLSFESYVFPLTADVASAITAPFADTLKAEDKISFTIKASTAATAIALQVRVNSLGF